MQCVMHYGNNMSVVGGILTYEALSSKDFPSSSREGRVAGTGSDKCG